MLNNPVLRQRSVRNAGNLVAGMRVITRFGHRRFYRLWRSRFGFVIAVGGVTELRKAFLR